MTEGRARLLTSEPEDRAAWMSLWRSCGRDPFAHPAYVQLWAGEGERASLLTVVDERGSVIMPLILRNVAMEPWASGVQAHDATSPYGYGGPYASSNGPHDAFWPTVAEWMLEEGLVSLIGRLSLEASVTTPLPESMLARPISDNVVVDLTRPPDEQWRHYAHKVRKNVNKARRAGLSAKVMDEFSDLGEFASLYQSTMERRGAAARYYFDERFFTTIAESLRGSFLVAEVRDRSGRLVSAELLLKSDRLVYSFLGGTAADAFPYAPNDLLKHEVIDHARADGLVAYVLGGGYQPGDGIFRYKLGFDPTGVVPFRRLEALVPGRSHEMLELRMAWERRHHPTAELDATFFPRYRAPLTGYTT